MHPNISYNLKTTTFQSKGSIKDKYDYKVAKRHLRNQCKIPRQFC